MPSFSHEKLYGRLRGKIICGVDEVGRGPLAGPVMAAAAILPEDMPRALLKEIRDSKKMSARQREDLFEPIQSHCLTCVASSSVEEITQHNILHAALLAMQRAVAGLTTEIDLALIDGNRCPQLACKAVAIIGGDDASYSIAAASIIAKVTRDRLMKKLAEAHPGYGWEHNAGYGTREHLDALSRLGPTGWHRAHFSPVAQLLLNV